MIDRATGQSRCIGFVRFHTIDQATAAMEGMHGSPRGDATLNVKYADDDRQKELRKRIRQQNSTSTSPPFAHSVNQISYSVVSSSASLDGRVDGTRRTTPTAFVSVPWPAPYGWTPPVFPSVYDPAHASWLLVYPTESFSAPSTSHRGSLPQHSYSIVPNIAFPSIDPNSDPRTSGEAPHPLVQQQHHSTPSSHSKEPES